MRKVILGGLGLVLVAAVAWVFVAREGARDNPAIDDNDIGGTVTGAKGPEAGVWVIA